MPSPEDQIGGADERWRWERERRRWERGADVVRERQRGEGLEERRGWRRWERGNVVARELRRGGWRSGQRGGRSGGSKSVGGRGGGGTGIRAVDHSLTLSLSLEPHWSGQADKRRCLDFGGLEAVARREPGARRRRAAKAEEAAGWRPPGQASGSGQAGWQRIGRRVVPRRAAHQGIGCRGGTSGASSVGAAAR
ncbi:hypothetical protein E2562_018766 [Oryza meyeriana var. granulata]|uniref:DUF834 domain-containing protein n=1 Tax=Oryza meyeriana var. granulata TaxID=110450 RepID=A0A6G1EXB2_9ORYZ|nr:hypothetical protein E2562_018766 [Oryza meyeriana var. granulata]